MSDVWLTIGLFDTCDETMEPVATFETLHAIGDLDEINQIIKTYNDWASDQPDVTLVAAAFEAEAIFYAD